MINDEKLIEHATRFEKENLRSIQMSNRTVSAGQSISVGRSNYTAVFILCLGLTIMQVPMPANADDNWGCLSQSLFWVRVKEIITESNKSHEITLIGRHHDSGYQHYNEYFKSLHIFDDGSWVIFDTAIRDSKNEILYCLLSRGSSSTLHSF